MGNQICREFLTISEIYFRVFSIPDAMEKRSGKLYGIRFEIDYSHLRNTDLAWIFSQLRKEAVELILDRRYAPYEVLKRKPLLFEVSEVRTGRSIVIDLFPLISQEASAWIPLLSGLALVLLKELLERWRERQSRQRELLGPYGKGRPHLHRIRTRLTSRRVRSDGTVSEEVSLEREEELVEWR